MSKDGVMTEKFRLKREHIKLLSNSSVQWLDAEFGAPAIRPDAPYGGDRGWEEQWHIMAAILGVEHPECLTEGQVDRLIALHRETETALEIVLETKSFKPGTYARDKNGRWVLEKKKKRDDDTWREIL